MSGLKRRLDPGLNKEPIGTELAHATRTPESEAAKSLRLFGRAGSGLLLGMNVFLSPWSLRGSGQRASYFSVSDDFRQSWVIQNDP